MEGTGTFKEKFESLKGTTKGRLVCFGLILLVNTAVLALLILVLTDICMMIFLVPITTFGIQYLFGERKLSRIVIVGLVIILISSLIFGVILHYYYHGYNAPSLEGSTTDGVVILRDGKVQPYSGDVGQRFNFTVTYYDTSGRRPLEISVNIASLLTNSTVTKDMSEVDPSDNDTTNGKKYFHWDTLHEDIHYMRFIARNSTGAWGNTTGAFGSFEQGPVNLPLAQFLVAGLFRVPELAMIFLLLVLLYWWTQKAKTYQPPRPPEEPKAEDEFTCSKCGADVPGDATKCPKCGEEFEEDEEEKKEDGRKETVMASKADMGYCRVCNRRVNKGDMMLGCQCGRAYHLKCANSVGKCPACGTEFM